MQHIGGLNVIENVLLCLYGQVLTLFVVDWLEKKNWSPNSQPPILNISHVTLLFSCNKQLGTNQRPLRGQGQGTWPGSNWDKNRKLHEARKQQWSHCRCCSSSSSFTRTQLKLLIQRRHADAALGGAIVTEHKHHSSLSYNTVIYVKKSEFS